MPTWMFNEQGRALAPWMLDQFDPENLKKTEEAAAARKAARARAIEEASAQGDLARDPQQMELSGLGLRSKMIGDDVELTWRTGDETGNKGFIISKRAGKSDAWQVVGSYANYPPLNSKGPDGGTYRFIDPETELGTWIYRVTDVNESGKKNDLCQALVEVQTEGEQAAVKIAVAGELFCEA
ncbi:unnamed protein product [Chrysoparadoxa australica]